MPGAAREPVREPARPPAGEGGRTQRRAQLRVQPPAPQVDGRALGLGARQRPGLAARRARPPGQQVRVPGSQPQALPKQAFQQSLEFFFQPGP